jgi:hypothetical protein
MQAWGERVQGLLRDSDDQQPITSFQLHSCVCMQVSGERVQGLLRGWRLGSQSYLLQQPAHVMWQFSPELARLVCCVTYCVIYVMCCVMCCARMHDLDVQWRTVLESCRVLRHVVLHVLLHALTIERQ